MLMLLHATEAMETYSSGSALHALSHDLQQSFRTVHGMIACSQVMAHESGWANIRAVGSGLAAALQPCICSYINVMDRHQALLSMAGPWHAQALK